MRYLLRFASNSLAIYLGLYLVDSLVAPRFWIKSWWLAVILAVLMGALNSLIRPLHRLSSRPRRALAVAVATVAMNALILQVFVWMRAPISTSTVAWVFVPAAFVSLLGGMINRLVGFNIKEKPGTVTRERREKQQEKEAGSRSRPRGGAKPARRRGSRT